MDWNALSDAFAAATGGKTDRGLAEQAVKDARQKLQAPQHYPTNRGPVMVAVRQTATVPVSASRVSLKQGEKMR